MVKLQSSCLIALMVAGLGVSAPAAAAPRAAKDEVTVSATVGDTVNVNTAGVKDLMSLRGIRRKVAERIVEYREAHGPFKKPEDLRKVEGVGPALWERNRDRIVVK
jgi:competence protein ComEA